MYATPRTAPARARAACEQLLRVCSSLGPSFVPLCFRVDKAMAQTAANHPPRFRDGARQRGVRSRRRRCPTLARSLSAAAKGSFPIIMQITEGRGRAGRPRVRSGLALLRTAGYVVIAIEYRHAPEWMAEQIVRAGAYWVSRTHRNRATPQHSMVGGPQCQLAMASVQEGHRSRCREYYGPVDIAGWRNPRSRIRDVGTYSAVNRRTPAEKPEHNVMPRDHLGISIRRPHCALRLARSHRRGAIRRLCTASEEAATTRAARLPWSEHCSTPFPTEWADALPELYREIYFVGCDAIAARAASGWPRLYSESAPCAMILAAALCRH